MVLMWFSAQRKTRGKAWRSRRYSKFRSASVSKMNIFVRRVVMFGNNKCTENDEVKIFVNNSIV